MNVCGISVSSSEASHLDIARVICLENQPINFVCVMGSCWRNIECSSPEFCFQSLWGKTDLGLFLLAGSDGFGSSSTSPHLFGQMPFSLNLLYSRPRDTRPKTVQCPECDKMFCDRSSMIYHKKAIHERLTFTCTCGRVYNHRRSMSYHQKTCSVYLTKGEKWDRYEFWDWHVIGWNQPWIWILGLCCAVRLYFPEFVSVCILNL